MKNELGLSGLGGDVRDGQIQIEKPHVQTGEKHAVLGEPKETIKQ